MLKVGTRCYIKKAGVASMRAHNKYRLKGYMLKCPCNYSEADELVVVSQLSNTLAMVSPVLHPKVLTICVWSDLHKI